MGDTGHTPESRGSGVYVEVYCAVMAAHTERPECQTDGTVNHCRVILFRMPYADAMGHVSLSLSRFVCRSLLVHVTLGTRVAFLPCLTLSSLFHACSFTSSCPIPPCMFQLYSGHCMVLHGP